MLLSPRLSFFQRNIFMRIFAKPSVWIYMCNKYLEIFYYKVFNLLWLFVECLLAHLIPNLYFAVYAHGLWYACCRLSQIIYPLVFYLYSVVYITGKFHILLILYIWCIDFLKIHCRMCISVSSIVLRVWWWNINTLSGNPASQKLG